MKELYERYHKLMDQIEALEAEADRIAALVPAIWVLEFTEYYPDIAQEGIAFLTFDQKALIAFVEKHYPMLAPTYRYEVGKSTQLILSNPKLKNRDWVVANIKSYGVDSPEYLALYERLNNEPHS